jgi:hypothetical protein
MTAIIVLNADGSRCCTTSNPNHMCKKCRNVFLKHAQDSTANGKRNYYERQVDPNDVLVVPNLIQNAIPDYSGQGGVSPRSQTDPDVPAPDLDDLLFGRTFAEEELTEPEGQSHFVSNAGIHC